MVVIIFNEILHYLSIILKIKKYIYIYYIYIHYLIEITVMFLLAYFSLCPFSVICGT